MQLVVSMLISIFLIHSPLLVFANNDQIPNFIPGDYELKSGNSDQCASGDFKYVNDGESLALNGLHIFSLKNNSSSLEDQISDKKRKCLYNVTDTIETIGDTTNLTSKEIYSCRGVIVYSLIKKARITTNGATLDTVQTGKPTFSYNCEWVKSTRATSSLQPPKNPKQNDKLNPNKK